MTYEEVFAKASKLLNKAKVKDVADHIAVQFNIEGEGAGAFYAEVSEGKIDVQPYDYKNNDFSVNVSADELFDALENKKGDTLPFYGNEEKIAALKPALVGIPKARKAAAKKTETAEKKTTAKTAAKETKTTAKKTAAKKTTKKAAE